MIWNRKSTRSVERVVRTGFFTSLVSYAGFWLIDLSTPGFVSNYLSVHVFLLGALVFGVAWSFTVESYRERVGLQAISALLLGIVLSVLVWHASDGLEGYRGLLLLITLPTPLLVLKLLTV